MDNMKSFEELLDMMDQAGMNKPTYANAAHDAERMSEKQWETKTDDGETVTILDPDKPHLVSFGDDRRFEGSVTVVSIEDA